MRIFVSGASGFIGRAFCEASVTAGHEILGLSRVGREGNAGCRFIAGSLESVPWSEIEAFAPDAALHLAWFEAPGSDLDSSRNAPMASLSEALLSGLALRGVRHLAAAGSALEYAPCRSPMRESSSITTTPTAYARAKMAVNSTLKSAAELARCDWTWFRLFFVYGNGEPPGRLIPWLTRRLGAGQSVELRTPYSIRDFVHVEDAAAAILHALETRLAGLVNVGSGTGTRLCDLAREIACLMRADASLINQGDPAANDPLPVAIADISRMKSIGWTPKVSLREGLQRLRTETASRRVPA